jgi:hypothetical protein
VTMTLCDNFRCLKHRHIEFVAVLFFKKVFFKLSSYIICVSIKSNYTLLIQRHFQTCPVKRGKMKKEKEHGSRYTPTYDLR